MNFKTHFIFSIFAVNELELPLFARSAPKNAIFGAFLTDFPQKPTIYSKKLTPHLQNFRVFEKTQGPWEKTQAFGKNSSFLASKLNEPVVTNYTRYHKRVKTSKTMFSND